MDRYTLADTTQVDILHYDCAGPYARVYLNSFSWFISVNQGPWYCLDRRGRRAFREKDFFLNISDIHFWMSEYCYGHFTPRDLSHPRELKWLAGLNVGGIVNVKLKP